MQVLGRRPNIYDEPLPVTHPMIQKSRGTSYARTIRAQTQYATLESWKKLSAPLTDLLQLPASVIRPTDMCNTRQGSPDFETHHPDTKGEISKSTSIVGILRNAERETTVIDACKLLGSCFKMWETR